MKLEFKILWFDDQPKELDGPKAFLERYLMRQGFKLVTRHVSEVKDLNSLLPTLVAEGSPDLIMMDWNMGTGTHGDSVNGSDVAKAIRSRFKYQEIVFYSAAAPKELRKAIFDKDIDGVFCVNRKNLQAETREVINIMLRKVVDINQMRGVVMSHVSEFDIKISECLSELHDKADSTVQKQIVDELHKVIKNFHESKLKNLESTGPDSSPEDYKKMSVLNVRYKILNKFLKDLAPDGSIETTLEIFAAFENDILIPRNALAHAKEVREKKEMVLKHNGKTYNNSVLSEIRKALLDHEDNLQCIYDSIQSGHFTPTCTD